MQSSTSMYKSKYKKYFSKHQHNARVRKQHNIQFNDDVLENTLIESSKNMISKQNQKYNIDHNKVVLDISKYAKQRHTNKTILMM